MNRCSKKILSLPILIFANEAKYGESNSELEIILLHESDEEAAQSRKMNEEIEDLDIRHEQVKSKKKVNSSNPTLSNTISKLKIRIKELQDRHKTKKKKKKKETVNKYGTLN